MQLLVIGSVSVQYSVFQTMADYFDEMGWQPLAEGEQPNHFLHLARLLRDYNMFEELGDTTRLPPPASKEIIEKLPNATEDVEGIPGLNFIL